MPLHDWTRVSAGTFHGFHTHFISELARVLNNDLLPESFYAEPEQIVGDTVPDVLALEAASDGLRVDELDPNGHLLTLTDAPPQATVTQTASEVEVYAEKRNLLAIRHSSGDRVVAYIEIVSPGNKSPQRSLEKFVEKACSVLRQNVHLVVVDVHPPGSFDPSGIHCVIWDEFNPVGSFEFPDERNRTIAAYRAADVPTAYIEPISVGDLMPSMPLFLTDECYIALPLEEAYGRAFSAMPSRYRRLLSE